MLKKAVLILGLLALAGCKLHVIALKGGEVQSPTGAGTCLEQTSCFHDIADTSFAESFEAVPAPGYVFVKWYGGEGFQCRNSTDTICTVNSGILAGLVSDTQIAAANDIYIMPVFQPEGAPITDMVVADGKEWAQPKIFIEASRDNLVAACPGGVCAGSVNGYDVTGWTWASGDEVAQMLYNEYGLGDGTLDSSVEGQCFELSEIFVDPLSPGYPLILGPWTPEYAFGTSLDLGFVIFTRGLGGDIRDTPNSFYITFAASDYPTQMLFCSAGTLVPSWASADTGAWLYRAR